MDVRTAARVHFLRMNMLHSRTLPAIAQPAPVMDRYHGLRVDLNSISISQARRDANNRMAPHANRLNTIHRSMVTPKGRFCSIDLFSFNRSNYRLALKAEAVFQSIYSSCLLRRIRGWEKAQEVFSVIRIDSALKIGIELFGVWLDVKNEGSCQNVVQAFGGEVLGGFKFL